jgi:protoporphyrinogen oxidase
VTAADRSIRSGPPSSGPNADARPRVGARVGARVGPHVGIVGGGMLGLGLASQLAKSGHTVTVMEGAPMVGGLAAADDIGGVTWDRFYHVTLLSDSYLRALLDDIGLGDRLRWKTTRTGFYTGGRLVSMSSSLDFLRFPPLGLIGKARLGWTIFYASRITDPAPLEQITVVDWLTRLSGRDTVERIWLPLLRSKLGENYRQASAAFIWAIIARLYAARRSGLKREMFGYVEGGYDAVLTRLRSTLESRGIEIATGRPATEVRGDAAGSEVRFADGAVRKFDAVILTVPCGRVAALCPQLTGAERDRLQRVVYQGVICPSLLLARPLADYYVTNITDTGIPFTGVIEMTALVDPAAFGGRSLVYLPRYLAQDDPTWKRTDDDLVAETVATLARMYPHFRQSDVLASRVARVREVHALSTIDYTRSLLPPLETSIDRVFVVNSAQIAQGTLNVNETLALASRQAEALISLIRPANVGAPSSLAANGSAAATGRAAAAVSPPTPVAGAHS